MVYRFKLKGNPRATLTLGMIVILISTAFTLLLRLKGSVALGLGVLSLMGAWYLFRFYRRHSKSYIETTDENLICNTATNGKITIPWEEITHFGLAQGKKSKMIYVYQESRDQLLTIPEDFQNYRSLVGEFSGRAGYEEKELKDRKEIIKYLSDLLRNSEESLSDSEG